MKSKYYKITINTKNIEDSDILIAKINLFTDFESVIEEEDFIEVCFLESKEPFELIDAKIEKIEGIESFTKEVIEEKNWNEVFEQSFIPVILDDNSWGVRATFHQKLNTTNEIIIDPKMSFGTGHHSTTFQMIQTMNSLDFIGKNVFDYGCGTGILAIMANLKGAKSVKAIDNEEWAFNNSLENFQLNNSASINLMNATLSEAYVNKFIDKEEQFDIILANITKNVLISSSKDLANLLSINGLLILSGFYTEDMKEIEMEYIKLGLKNINYSSKENWICLTLQKKH